MGTSCDTRSRPLWQDSISKIFLFSNADEASVNILVSAFFEVRGVAVRALGELQLRHGEECGQSPSRLTAGWPASPQVRKAAHEIVIRQATSALPCPPRPQPNWGGAFWGPCHEVGGTAAGWSRAGVCAWRSGGWVRLRARLAGRGRVTTGTTSTSSTRATATSSWTRWAGPARTPIQGNFEGARGGGCGAVGGAGLGCAAVARRFRQSACRPRTARLCGWRRCWIVFSTPLPEPLHCAAGSRLGCGGAVCGHESSRGAAAGTTRTFSFEFWALPRRTEAQLTCLCCEEILVCAV